MPKAPASLLARIVGIFKGMPDREAVLSVVYDRREKRHHLVWNDQRDQTSGSVTYDPIPETGRIVPYADIHSHNQMGAFYSRTDDEFEVRTGIYGVVGRVDEERPEAMFRYSCGGLFRPLSSGEVFHNPSGAPALGAIVRDLYFEEPHRQMPSAALTSRHIPTGKDSDPLWTAGPSGYSPTRRAGSSS